ncbi:hypothetical protein GCM10009422_16450 [Brevundimonas kwangchunensis]|uniref:HTH cro/C1-type domain-containing protein n=1 Tax=Brevundimonas kwangchunensis TaxID=322163 RepID=A0ABN1GW47_9CAUL
MGRAANNRATGEENTGRSPDLVDIHVGSRIRDERTNLGMTQTDLGTAIGVTFQQVQKYERGLNRVSASMLVRIAEALGVDIGDLFPAQDAARATLAETAEARRAELVSLIDRLKPRQRQLIADIARQFAKAA